MRIARIKNRVDSRGRWERLKEPMEWMQFLRGVRGLSLERNVGKEDEFRVSGDIVVIS